MKKIILCILIVFGLLACTYTPYRSDSYRAPRGVSEARPDYPAPNPEYRWRYDDRGHSWGWHHPRHGWHRR